MIAGAVRKGDVPLLAAVTPPLRLVTLSVTVVPAPSFTSATVSPKVAVLLAWPDR